MSRVLGIFLLGFLLYPTVRSKDARAFWNMLKYITVNAFVIAHCCGVAWLLCYWTVVMLDC